MTDSTPTSPSPASPPPPPPEGDSTPAAEAASSSADAEQSPPPHPPHHSSPILVGIYWFCTALAAAMFILAYALPVRGDIESAFYGWLLYIACMTRTFLLHGGVIVLSITFDAALRKLWRLTVVSGVVGVVFLIPIVGSWFVAGREPVSKDSITLVTANLYSENPTPEKALDALLDKKPDVLVLQEYTPAFDKKFGDKLRKTFEYHQVEPREGNYGEAVYSHRAMGAQVITQPPFADADSPKIRFSVLLGNHRATFYDIHMLYQWIPAGVQQFDGLMTQLQSERGPVGLVGDFNMTNNSPQFPRLEALGFRDGPDLAGFHPAMTWPSDRKWGWLLWPGFRIDHVYLSPELTATQAEVVYMPGSDHEALCMQIHLVVPH